MTKNRILFFKFNKKTINKFNDILFFILCLIGVIYYIFFESISIGRDFRYTLYIFLIPTFLGLFLTAKFTFFSKSWNSLFSNIKNEKYLILKIVYPFLLLTSNFIFSYIYFGSTANIVWDTINKLEASKNETEKFFLPITKIYRFKNKSRIKFEFKNEEEIIYARYSDMKKYLNKDIKNFQIEINVKKGIWNYYIVQSWKIREVSKQ